MSENLKFFSLGKPERIWTISAINGRPFKLQAIHRTIFEKFRTGDKIVYTGNYLCGPGARPRETLEEIIHFHAMMLERKDSRNRPLCSDSDIVYLRGIQEELWDKLMCLQFAQNPEQIVSWIADKYSEMEVLLADFGSSFEEAARISREGILSLTRWTNAIKARMRENAGYEKFFTALRRAAVTGADNDNDTPLLFVHAGFNPKLPLISQGDSFWWSSAHFNDSDAPYAPFRAVIRGHDPQGRGLHIGKNRISLDGGCGENARLICAHVDNFGRILEVIAA